LVRSPVVVLRDLVIGIVGSEIPFPLAALPVVLLGAAASATDQEIDPRRRTPITTIMAQQPQSPSAQNPSEVS
jgi:hypothetical protein